jgi:hypothetical protein
VVEVNTTYVIVHLWDLRHLVVPLSYFIEKPFQNWTRYSSDLIGVVLLYTDYGASRQASGRVPANSGELAALGSKSDGRASDRCEGTQRRTALPDERRQSHYYLRPARLCSREVDPYLQEHYPQALARIRSEVSLVDASSKGIAHSASQRPDA